TSRIEGATIAIPPRRSIIVATSAAIRLSNATTRSPPNPGVMSEEVDAVSGFIFRSSQPRRIDNLAAREASKSTRELCDSWVSCYHNRVGDDPMNRRIIFAGTTLLISLALTTGAFAQTSPSPQASPSADSAREPLFDRLGNLHHPATTNSPLAQRFFDQGLTFVYAF